LKGPRDCIGKYFAVLESKLAIAALVQRYDMACVDPNEGIAYRMTAIPMDGANMKFKEQRA
jgi:cytochrome P450